MPRQQKPWYRASRGAWYAQINGKQVLLARGKDARSTAYAELHRLMAGKLAHTDEVVPGTITVEQLVTSFLANSRSRVAKITLEGYERFLIPFSERYAARDPNQLQPLHVSDWLDEHTTWGPTTQRNAVTAVKTAWKWAFDQGRIAANNLSKCRRPMPAPQREIPTELEVERFFSAIQCPEFKLLMRFLYETGCRPGEAIRIEAKHCNLAECQIVLRQHKTGRTGKPRVIYLGPTTLATVKQLCEINKTGPIFLNSKGGPWTRNAISCQMARIRNRVYVGKDMIAYALRHLWITDALVKGVPIKTVAEMAGHSSTDMIDRVYGHLGERKSALQEVAELMDRGRADTDKAAQEAD